MEGDIASVDVVTLPAAFSLVRVGRTWSRGGGFGAEELSIAAGLTTAIVGRSGSGKTTLLHLLAGILPPDPGGEQLVAHMPTGDVDLLRRKARRSLLLGTPEMSGGMVGIVFQQPILLRDATCRQNLDLALDAGGRAPDPAVVKELWTSLGLDLDKLNQPARELSGGQQQRLAIARALIRRPSVVFADEPTANLDLDTARDVMTLLRDWQRGKILPSEDGAPRTLVFITHAAELVCEFADHFIALAPPESGGNWVGRLQPGPWPQVVSAERGGTGACTPCAAKVHRWISGVDEKPAPTKLRITPSKVMEASGTLPMRPTRGRIDSLWWHVGMRLALSRDIAWRSVMFLILIWMVCILTGSLADSFEWWWRTALAIGLLATARVPLHALSTSSNVRALGFFALLLLGLVTATAQVLFEARGASMLDRPDINPVLVSSNGRERWMPDRVTAIDKELREHIGRAGGADDGLIFGRSTASSVQVFAPAATAGAAPDCASPPTADGALATTEILGISPEEPFWRRWSWRTPGGPEAPTVNAALTERVAWAPRGTPPPELHARNGSSGDWELYLAADLLGERGLELPDEALVPNWLCVRDPITGRDVARRVVAMVPRLPGFNGREFGLVVPEPVAREYAERNVRRAENRPLSHLAITLAPGAEDATLGWLDTQSGPGGRFRVESGFDRARAALDEVAGFRRIAFGFYVAVSLMCLVVCYVFARQFFDSLRRELVVCRALGADWWHLAQLASALLMVPLAWTTLVSTAVGALLVPPLVTKVATMLQLTSPITMTSVLIPVCVVVSLIWIVVAVVGFGTTLQWLNQLRLGSISEKLREDA